MFSKHLTTHLTACTVPKLSLLAQRIMNGPPRARARRQPELLQFLKLHRRLRSVDGSIELLSFESSGISRNAISQVEVAKNLSDLVDSDPRIPASVSTQQSIVTNGIHQAGNSARGAGNE